MTTLADQERYQRQFAGLCQQLRVEPDRNGEAWIDCPWCGKDNKHFSFSERGYKCFLCDRRGKSLLTLAQQLQLQPSERPVRPRQEAPRPRQWQQAPDRWLDRYCEALDRLERWQAYKPLSLDTIARFRLGVGVLPSSRCKHRRLIVPVFDGDRIVAFHGRAFRSEDTDEKWLCAGGSNKRILWHAGALWPGCVVVVVENYVDAILAWQCDPSHCYVPLGGVGWQSEWAAQIAEYRPRGALVWLDHDLAGNGSRWHHREMLEAWRLEMTDRRAADPKLAARPFPLDPEPRAPKIANELLAAGIRTHIYEWPKGSAWKADIGSELMK